MWWDTRRKQISSFGKRTSPFKSAGASVQLLAEEVCTSTVVTLDWLTPCFEVVGRVLVTHSIRQFPLYFPSRASPCAITFQLDSTDCTGDWVGPKAGLDGGGNKQVMKTLDLPNREHSPV